MQWVHVVHGTRRNRSPSPPITWCTTQRACYAACETDPWGAPRRYVRQDDALWQALHAGTLTTSVLPGALGMKEPWAARQIQGPQVCGQSGCTPSL